MGNFGIVIFQKLFKGLKEQIKDPEKRKQHILENMLY